MPKKPEEPAKKTTRGNRPRKTAFTGLRKDVSAREQMQWVADHIEIADVQPADAPTLAAWNHLRAVRNSETARKDFWAKWMTRSLREGDEQHGGDRMPLVELIDQVRDMATGALVNAADRSAPVRDHLGRAISEPLAPTQEH